MKRRETEEDRAYWDFVERVAKGKFPDWKRGETMRIRTQRPCDCPEECSNVVLVRCTDITDYPGVLNFRIICDNCYQQYIPVEDWPNL